jgi:hypothetical protein
MLDRKISPALMFLIVLGAMLLASSTISAQMRGNDSPQNIRKEFVAAASSHQVSIDIDKMLFAGDQNILMAHAPITGMQKYGDKNFAVGAPIQLLIIRSALRYDIPNGSYVVKAQYEPGATSGKAIFLDQNGKVAATRKLYIKSLRESAAYFPDVYGGEPQDIPVITSWHVFGGYYFDKQTNTWKPRYLVDCAGWDPYRVLYY